MIFNMIAMGASAGGGGDVYAFILATYPAGSVCTASNGTITLTASNTSGNFVFRIPTPVNTPEIWTITCTDGARTASANVTISTEGQSENVLLQYSFYLIKNGVLQPGITFPVSIRTGRTCTVTAENGYQRFSLAYSGGARTDNMIDVSNFSALYADIQPGGDTIYTPSENRYPATIGLMQTESAVDYLQVYNVLSHKVSAITKTRQTLTLDLFSVTGTYNVAVTIQNSTSTAYCDVYNLWFE